MTDNHHDAATVSIRSPHRSKGRPRLGPRPAPGGQFQSAPLTEARGDGPSARRRFRTSCFNPLPSPKQGETGDPLPVDPLGERGGFNPLPSPKQGETSLRRSGLPMWRVSIRSPHRSKGRPAGESLAKEEKSVSIRSPHRSKGRQVGSHLLVPCGMFQSAPLTEARGDFVEGVRRVVSTSFNPLPSPKQGETA